MRGASSSDDEVDVDGVGEGRRREDEDAAGRGGRLVEGIVVLLSGDLERFASFPPPEPSLRALISL